VNIRSIPHRAWRVCVLFCLLAACPAALAFADNFPESADENAKEQIAPVHEQEKARLQLDAAARAHLERVSRTLRPNLDNKEVTREETGFVARYLTVDAELMSTELTDSRGQGCAYLGNVIYMVHEYQSTGATMQEALNGSFQKVKSRRIREFTHYAGGKWQL